ncbi:hypothetical protein CDL12_27251 [Handroanthus impetiginosus]|uniref:Nuclear nucleic acid-binding protein C1D n=1 Tax=Handroanthus impetiginosus TaxID=429701 RepID=A0A2G9G4K4_9LAMI|nr:hypothetical protein CDL12_27251 [Handroanthus impetiginosus]
MGNDSNEAIPESVKFAVEMTSRNIDELKLNLEKFLICCDNETLSRMGPLERAQALYLIAQIATNLLALRLKCRGVDIRIHPIKKEFERLCLYEEKLQHWMDLEAKHYYEFASRE